MAIERVDDAELVARAQDGDGPALNELVSRHHAAVYRVTQGVLGDPDLAADATQDTFVRALGALAGFRGDASFRTWLLRIATNTARSAGRRTTSRREVPLEPVVAPVEKRADPARALELRFEVERVEAAMARLPEKQRLAVSLRVNEGLSHREIGEVIDSSEGSARVNYHLGLKRLREMLA